MSYINILDKDTKEQTLTYLYSPNSDGIYSGYMNVSSWLNFWGKENDGTIWGNVGQDGHVYEMDNTESAWSFWFPGQAGIYYAVIDTKAKEFKPTLLKSFQLNGEDMTYDAPNYAWTKVITTTADNTPVSIVATGAEYSKATGTEDAAAVVKTMNYTLADGKMTDSENAGSVNIPTAGTYTITVKVGDKSDLTYSIVSGDQTTPKPTISNTIGMFSKDGSTLYATFTKVSEGVYTCTYDLSNLYDMRFYFIGDDIDDKRVCYGSVPNSQFSLYKEEDDSNRQGWDIWFNEDAKSMESAKITVDLNTMTWKYE